ncbi:MAG: hypothetical protein HKP59_00110 [Lutibacter sp.]|nr:hypothetical protein [Lutibacter sp.]NNJ56867.1 hypothetical protein [Lutibacter sp.]
MFIVLSCAVLEAQELPPIENYSPKLYNAENQNWSISQSFDQQIYIANNSGLLAFNGAKWKLYPSPNNTIIRSVSVINSRIYTGSYMEFGYWEKNEFGSLDYFSLSAKIEDRLVEEEFWNIIEYDTWVLFQSLNRIYIFNTIDESFQIIKSDTQLPKIFKVEDSIYFQKMNDGVYKIENGKEVLISNNPILQNSILVNIFYVNRRILFQTQDKGFYYLENDELHRWKIDADTRINSISVYSSLQLSDGSFVLGTIANGLFHLDENGNILYQISQKNGLNNNTVLSIFEDSTKNVWLGLDNGVSVINLDSPFSVYNDINGELGTIYASAIFNGNLYLGTNQGLFFKKRESNQKFKFIEGTKGQVWTLKEFDNTLFCGHNSGTFIVKNDKVSLISDLMGTWDIKQVKSNKNILLQGNYNGLNVLEKKNNTWKFRNKIKGFDISSRYFEVVSKNTILVSHEYKGVFKIKVDSTLTKIYSYATENTVPKGLKSSLAAYNNNLYYTSEKGIFKYDDSEDIFKKDSVFTKKLFSAGEYISGKLIPNNQTQTLWGFTNNNLVYFSQGKLNNIPQVTKLWLPASLRSNVTGYESITHIEDQKFLLGTLRGYIIIDLEKFRDKDFEVNINSVDKRVINESKISVPLTVDGTFEFKEHNLFFSFSVPEYDRYTEVNYQYKLEGIYTDWTSWSTFSEVSFENLPYGNYTFKVKAKINNKLSTNIATYSFKISRPWVVSYVMIFVYFVLFLLLLILIHFFYKKYYTRQKILLIEKNHREFELNQLEAEKRLMKIKNEQLNQEIESKNRELTISTMSIIKKNEILNSIKKELISSKGAQDNKQAISAIDKNINNKKDWEFLEEAINNADKDFLKKIKILHPELTPNDLRFCAYLRLNLTSKEIAPLLNISVRSVEIKRYRLRKKMSLAHKKSLVAYILAI